MRYPDRPPYDPGGLERIIVEAGAPTTAETLAEIGAVCARAASLDRVEVRRAGQSPASKAFRPPPAEKGPPGLRLTRV